MRLPAGSHPFKLKRQTIIFAALTTLSAAVFTLVIMLNGSFPADLAVTRFWQSLTNPALTAFMQALTWSFGDWRAAVLTVLLVITVFFRIGRREALMVAGAGLLSLISTGLKAIFAQPRPAADQVQILVRETYYSFPSSHAFFAIMLLGTLIYLLNRRVKSKRIRIFVAVLLIITIVLVGLTRVYLGVHWYSDVLAGYCYGGFFLTGLIAFFDHILPKVNSSPYPVKQITNQPNN
jgi:undecaprenyl-diphosphatase